jgi:hypothetical protein
MLVLTSSDRMLSVRAFCEDFGGLGSFGAGMLNWGVSTFGAAHGG